jgi:hypothetical protein
VFRFQDIQVSVFGEEGSRFKVDFSNFHFHPSPFILCLTFFTFHRSSLPKPITSSCAKNTPLAQFLAIGQNYNFRFIFQDGFGGGPAEFSPTSAFVTADFADIRR